MAVQQLQDALEARRPQVEILSPVDGALLPEGPWTLQLRVEDWPLVDAGPLGLGPHLVVQLDGDPPLPLTTTTTTMRPLEPGSHRLTVYAARPWGEAVKSPGAQRQIRLAPGRRQPPRPARCRQPPADPRQPPGAGSRHPPAARLAAAGRPSAEPAGDGCRLATAGQRQRRQLSGGSADTPVAGRLAQRQQCHPAGTARWPRRPPQSSLQQPGG